MYEYLGVAEVSAGYICGVPTAALSEAPPHGATQSLRRLTTTALSLVNQDRILEREHPIASVICLRFFVHSPRNTDGVWRKTEGLSVR